MQSCPMPRAALAGAAALALAVVMAVAGCASVDEVVDPCCYDGPYTSARFERLDLTLEGGRTARFDEVFEGFRPSAGVLNRALPFRRAEIELVHLLHLHPLLHSYDANGNRILEEPELAVLYVKETARALGHRVDHVGGREPIGALAFANTDIGGLMRYIAEHRDGMAPEARRLFTELERVGDDMRRLHQTGGERDGRVLPR